MTSTSFAIGEASSCRRRISSSAEVQLTSGREQVGAPGAGDTEVQELKSRRAEPLAAAQGVVREGNVAGGRRVGGADSEGERVAQRDVRGRFLCAGGRCRRRRRDGQGQRQKSRQRRQETGAHAGLILGQVSERVYGSADVYLEVQVRACRVAGTAERADTLSLGDVLTLRDPNV